MKKEKQYGGAFIAFVCFVLVFAVSVFGVIGLFYNNAVQANKHEVQIRTQYQVNQNILGQLFPKLTELARVREMSIDDQVRLTEAIFGEDGRSGSQAAWQWVQEQNPTADLTIHKQIGQVIEASRNKFENAQTLLQSHCQLYNDRLNHPLHGTILEFLGYPDKKMKDGQVTIAKACTVVQSSHSRGAFESGIDDGATF